MHIVIVIRCELFSPSRQDFKQSAGEAAHHGFNGQQRHRVIAQVGAGFNDCVDLFDCVLRLGPSSIAILAMRIHFHISR